MKTYVLVNKTAPGAASGIAMARLKRSLNDKHIPFIEKQSWSGPLPEHIIIAAASRVIPYIMGFHMPVHPQLWYWLELNTGGALFGLHNHNDSMRGVGITYQETEPGDAGLFYPIAEYVSHWQAGQTDSRYTPYQVASQLVPFRSLPMQRRGSHWEAIIPADYITPEWDLLVYFESTAVDGSGILYPGIWHPKHPLPYFIIKTA